MNRVLRVLVVDDSAYVRKVMRQMLSQSPFLEVVGTARDGTEALEQAEALEPDVITLDLMMPEMDGITFLKAQMAHRPIPTVVVSIADEDSELALAALDAGAVDIVQKPTALANEKVLEITQELIRKVKAAAEIPLGRGQQLPTLPPEAPAPGALLGANLVDMVVLGISTGGPQALKWLVPQIPPNFPVPLAIVLHMPVGYTEMYAQKLNDLSPLKVVETREGDEVCPGVVYLAPAGRHLSFQRLDDGKVVTHLDARPFDTPHRPSVDVLFQSAAEVYDGRVLGVVMTGMGSDGLQGAAWIKAKGGLVLTEAEESCVVYGMPRVVVEAGLSDRTVPLSRMLAAILEVV
ncbi:MAG: chemotaxis-specific protein-glutamate methyltransferase CheB [Ardenticatenales bacterium]|nr:chemotaxis-specific protein-glutamate methyltransferase CheB [Ardenticatenales bacterium]